MEGNKDVKTKICTKCKIEKPLEEFHKDKNTKDGKSYKCKKCGHEYYKASIKNIIPPLGMSQNCTKCMIEKPLSEFYKNNRSKNGVRTICADCSNSSIKEKNNTPPLEGTIICKSCKLEKPVSEYSNCKKLNNGKIGICKSCERTRRDTTAKKDISVYFRRNLWGQGRKKKKLRKEDKDSVTQFVSSLYKESDKCSLTGLPMIIGKTKHRQSPYTPSIDRIDSKNGYTIDNVRLVRFSMNMALGEWGEEIYKENAIAYLEHHGYRITKEEELD